MVLMFSPSSASAQVVLSSGFLKLEIPRVGCYFMQPFAVLVLCTLGGKRIFELELP